MIDYVSYELKLETNEHPANIGNEAKPELRDNAVVRVIIPNQGRLTFTRHIYPDGSSGVVCYEVGGKGGWFMTVDECAAVLTAYLIIGCTVIKEVETNPL